MIPGIVAGRPVGGGGGGDPHWDDVLALLHFEGADGSTTFTDQKGGTWTRNGAAQIDTAQARFGTSSARIVDSTSDYLISPTLALGTAFTIEFWFYRETTAAMYLFSNYTGTAAIHLFTGSGSNDLTLTWAGVNRGTVVGGASVGAWHHAAIVQDGTQLPQFYVDGQGGTATGGTASTFTDEFSFGARSDNTLRLTGWIDELRITNAARYLAPFTPPSAPFPDG